MPKLPDQLNNEIMKHTAAIARLMGLDPVKYRVDISFRLKD